MGQLDLTGLLREHAFRHSVPGAAIGILRDGAVVTAHTGIADAITGEPVTSETRFAVGSLSKSMVATAVARLAGAGRLSLDDPVAAQVPELRGADWAVQASVRDLLANRSRLPCARTSSSRSFRATTATCSRGSSSSSRRAIRRRRSGRTRTPGGAFSAARWRRRQASHGRRRCALRSWTLSR